MQHIKLTLRAQSIEPKFPTSPTEKSGPPFETFPVGPHQSFEFWTKMFENYGWMDCTLIFGAGTPGKPAGVQHVSWNPYLCFRTKEVISQPDFRLKPLFSRDELQEGIQLQMTYFQTAQRIHCVLHTIGSNLLSQTKTEAKTIFIGIAHAIITNTR